MGSSSEVTNPLDQLRALRSEVIDRERSRMKGLLEEVPSINEEPAFAVPCGEGDVPVPDDSDAVLDRKPKKAKAVRRNPTIEGDELKVRLGTDLRRLLSFQPFGMVERCWLQPMCVVFGIGIRWRPRSG